MNECRGAQDMKKEGGKTTKTKKSEITKGKDDKRYTKMQFADKSQVLVGRDGVNPFITPPSHAIQSTLNITSTPLSQASTHPRPAPATPPDTREPE